MKTENSAATGPRNAGSEASCLFAASGIVARTGTAIGFLPGIAAPENHSRIAGRRIDTALMTDTAAVADSDSVAPGMRNPDILAL